MSSDPTLSPPAAHASRGPLFVFIAAVILGLLLRAYAVSLAPLNSYKPDHRDNMTWSAYAWQHGPHKIYDLPALTPILEKGDLGGGTIGVGFAQLPHACNYPPLSAFLFLLQGGLWTLLDADVQTVPLSPQAAESLGVTEVRGRVIETAASRTAQALPSILFDVPLALGVAALVAAARRSSRWGWSEAGAFAIAFLAPPVILDSAFWNQTDSWISAPLVWAVWALMTGRLTLAGVLWGVALMIKPQGILFAPVLGYFAISRMLEQGGNTTRLFAMWKTVAAAAIVVVLVSMPFMIADANHAEGPSRWFKRSYVATIGASEYQRTTLNAFNVWWLHWLSQEATREALDASASSLGIPRTLLGKILLSVAIIASISICGWAHKWRAASLLPLTAAIFLAAFTLPTSVHERYIYYCLPFFVAIAVLHPRVWGVPLIVLLVVATAEMLSFRWVKLPDPAVRSISTWLAVAVVFSFAWTLGALAIRSHSDEQNQQR